MEEHQMQIFLQNLYQTPDERILEVVFQGHVSMDAIRENVSDERYDTIQQLIEGKENEVFQREYESIKAEIEDPNSDRYTSLSNKDFQKAANEGRITQAQVELLCDDLQKRIEQETIKKDRERILTEMRSCHPHYKASTIKSLLSQGYITYQDLQDIGLSEKQIRKIEYFQKVRTDNRNEWGDLPPLREAATDVYMFGKAASGKSTMLGGILFQADRRGILRPDITNNIGIRYMDDLQNRIRQEILPDRTSVDNLNYISVDIKNKRDKYHRINFIEMSGERFEKTYESDYELTNSIGANNYLQNSNRKILFYVIDYAVDQFRLDFHDPVNQGNQLRTVLQILERDGTLSYTDALFLVVTKSDLIDTSKTSIIEGVQDYVKSEYLNLYNLCREYQERFNYHFEVLPSSLGTFILPDIYTFDPHFSDGLLNQIVNYSRPARKGGWLG